MVPGRVAGVETGPVGPLRQNLITAADSGVRAFGGRTPEGRRAILVLIDGRLARTGHEGSSRAVGCTVSDQPNDARPVGTRQQRFQCPGAVPRPPGVPDLRRSCLLEAAEVVVEGGHFLGCGAAEVVELDPVEAAFSLRGLEAVDPGVLGGRHHPLACPAVPAGLAHPIPSASGGSTPFQIGASAPGADESFEEESDGRRVGRLRRLACTEAGELPRRDGLDGRGCQHFVPEAGAGRAGLRITAGKPLSRQSGVDCQRRGQAGHGDSGVDHLLGDCASPDPSGQQQW